MNECVSWVCVSVCVCACMHVCVCVCVYVLFFRVSLPTPPATHLFAERMITNHCALGCFQGSCLVSSACPHRSTTLWPTLPTPKALRSSRQRLQVGFRHSCFCSLDCTDFDCRWSLKRSHVGDRMCGGGRERRSHISPCFEVIQMTLHCNHHK